MSWEIWLNYFAANFDYDLANRASDVNLKFNRLVNTIPIALPYENFWYTNNLTKNNRNMIWNKPLHWVSKRDGMKLIKELVWVYIWDDVIINWERYLAWFNEAGTKWYIYKAVDGMYSDWCGSVESHLCPTDYCEVASFETTPCSYKKLQIVHAPVWKPKKGIGKVVHRLIWGNIFATIVDSNGDPIWWQLWEYVYITNWWNNVATWQYREISWTYEWETLVFGNWIWLYDYVPNISQINNDTVTNRWNNNPWDKVVEGNIEYAIFPDVRATISFATNNWIYYITNLECWWDQHFIPILKDAKYPITWMFMWNNALWFITNNYAWFSQWWQNIWNFNYSVEMEGGIYTKWLPLMHYVIMLGPNNIWIVYQSWLDRNGNVIPRFKPVTDSFWYFSPYSYQDEHYWGVEEFTIFNSDNELVKWNIEPYANNLGDVNFKIYFSPVWNRLIDSELRSLDRDKWAFVTFAKDRRWYMIFINEWEKTLDAHSKVILYYDKVKNYHIWEFCNIKLYWMFKNVWYWSNIYCNKWDTDNWATFNQVIQLPFWDQTLINAKYIRDLQLQVWSDSILTKKTEMLIQSDLDWLSQLDYEDRWLNTQYIQDIMQTKTAVLWNINRVYREGSMCEYIYYWNGVWDVRNKIMNWLDTVRALCQYVITNTEEEACIEECAAEVILPSTHTYNQAKIPGQSNESFARYIAKIWQVVIPINRSWQFFGIQIMCTWLDKIELFWSSLAYSFWDNEANWEQWTVR